MKRACTFGLITFILTKAFAQAPLPESEKLASLCRVWGFLKYYHPAVAKGRVDWDSELRTYIRKTGSVKSKEELSAIYLEWIKSLGKIRPCTKCDKINLSDHFTANLDQGWMNNKSVFTDTLSATLSYILNNRNQGKNYYVSTFFFIGNSRFKNEKLYPDSVYPSSELRLIGLFRYWNAINYFFPYKYLMDKNWNSSLAEMIPKFKYAKDTIEYHLAMKEIVARINDGHAGFGTRYTLKYFGEKWAAFQFKIIESKAFITSFYNDSLAGLDDLRYGDVILKVENKTISEIVQERAKYFGASNDCARLNYLKSAIFNGSSDTVEITYERAGVTSTKIIHRYAGYQLSYKWTPDTIPLTKKINGEIGYVNMEKLKRSEVKKVIRPLLSCKGIVFDLRGYPQGTCRKILSYLSSRNVPFVKFTNPTIHYPGLFENGRQTYTGRSSKKYYKGKVVVLINENTQSQGEYTTMALKATPNAIVIGNNTAGADGDVSLFTFPGGYQTYFSGIGVYYPAGEETQRVGIVPDIKIAPTINGMRNKKDELLDRAVEYITTGK